MELQRTRLRNLLSSIQAEGKKVFGYGASTKGNVLLQYCGIDRNLLPAIVEINEDKFGSFTPGTNIPIVSEAEAMAQRPDYLMVLPWHFRDGILRRETDFLSRGGTFIFPLPELELVSLARKAASNVSR
jgi:C-methyltransferase C-terminal domain